MIDADVNEPVPVGTVSIERNVQEIATPRVVVKLIDGPGSTDEPPAQPSQSMARP